IGIEKTFASKIQLEKEVASLKDQLVVLTAERDSALAAPLLNARIKSLTQELEVSEGKRLSALARMAEVEAAAKVQAAELESCHTALLKEKREAEGLAKSLGDRQVALDSAEAAAAYWQGEWKSLAEETGEMVQETFDILMDQLCKAFLCESASHLPGDQSGVVLRSLGLSASNCVPFGLFLRRFLV
ncbi:hypothetical protein PIB30_106409, partial [Stylosanthes scabra]|nr:hypothetical protein [Stylosanthes scabra]